MCLYSAMWCMHVPLCDGLRDSASDCENAARPTAGGGGFGTAGGGFGTAAGAGGAFETPEVTKERSLRTALPSDEYL